MRIQIEQPSLVSALATVQGIIEKRNTVPILSHVHINAHDNKVTIRATDLDVEVTTSAPCEVVEPGECAVSADLLANVVKRMAKGRSVSMSMDGGRLHVESGKSKFEFGTLDASTFPEIASEEYTSQFDISAAELGRLLRRTAFAMSTDETRYHLQGVYLHHTCDGLTAVSTDGHRLAKSWSDEFEDDFPGVIIPRKTVSELSKVLDIGAVSISVSDTKIRLDLGDTVIVSKVVDATFVDYTRVIPQGLTDTFRIDAKEFSGAASRVALVSEDKVRAVKLSVGNGAVGLSVNGHDHLGEDEIEAVVNGAECEVGYNVKYLADILSQAEGGDVDFYYDGASPMNPAIIRPTEDERFLAVVLPMRV